MCAVRPVTSLHGSNCFRAIRITKKSSLWKCAFILLHEVRIDWWPSKDTQDDNHRNHSLSWSCETTQKFRGSGSGQHDQIKARAPNCNDPGNDPHSTRSSAHANGLQYVVYTPPNVFPTGKAPGYHVTSSMYADLRL